MVPHAPDASLAGVRRDLHRILSVRPAGAVCLVVHRKAAGQHSENDDFVDSNIRFIRRIRWCCAIVSVVCLAAGFGYPPLLFLAVIMAFLALVVSVVKNVMAAAVELREENDLTV